MKNIHHQAVNTIRLLAVDAVERANSGHPGMPMGAAPMAYTLWKDFMKFHPQNPKWFDRDRFVLSAGHGSALIYSLLHLFGYDLGMEDLKEFRQWGSKTPGHPEYHHTPGVETTTGPLGQGFGNGVGMAMAEEILAAHFNKEDIKLVDHYTYVIAGDGDMMEGIASEAASLAGNLKLGKLIVLYDSNNISIEGNTSITFTEDVGKRFEAYGWQVLRVEDGNDIEDIASALGKAREERDKPSLIEVRTTIGYGSPNKAGSAGVHGAPLGTEEARLTKENLGYSYDTDFHVTEEVKTHFTDIVKEKKKEAEAWEKVFQRYREKYPQLAQEWDQWHGKDLAKSVLEDDSLWDFNKNTLATRAASGEILNRLAQKIPNLIGGSADLAPSNNTYLKDLGDLSPEDRKGRNIRFGVREHGMGAVTNGLYLHGGLRPFCATFLIFSDYLRPSIRLASLMNLPIPYVFTHDSIAVGEDGPTHQPIEQLMSLRLIPGLRVFRPADAKETAAAWVSVLSQNERPTILALSRQNLPVLEQSGREALKGGYIIRKEKGASPDLIMMASGSEVHLAIEAAEKLLEKNIDTRVVSMPCWELFEEQEEAYREKVLPSSIQNRLAVEAGQTLGWERYTGSRDRIIGIQTFGTSAPGDRVMREYGFTVQNILSKAEELHS